MQESKYDSANYYLDLAINNCKNNCPDTTLANLFIQRGKSFKLLQKYEFALIDYRYALKLFQKHHNANGIVNTLIHLSEYYRGLHNFDNALLHIEKAQKVIQKTKISKKNRAYFYNRYAAILTEATTDRALTIQFSKKAIELAKEIGDKNIEASSLNELGFIYINKDTTKSFSYFRESLKLYEKLNNTRYRVDILTNISRAYKNIKDFKNSIKYADEGLKITQNKDWQIIKRDLYYIKYRSHYNLKEFEKAVIASNNCRIYAEKVLKTENDKALSELQIKYKLEDKNNQILVEQEKANALKKETEDKKSEINLILLIVILLAIILSISIIAYLKIRSSNRLLNKSVDQKEILLQEVHHRVKNNLTLLNSLLYLRAKGSEDENVISVLNECQSRVQAMALVHQNLYDVSDTSKVDFKKFISELFGESESMFATADKNTTIEIETNNIFFEMGFSVFLGLIINELITNSLKHGINKFDQSTISLRLDKNNNQYKMTYNDSGKGLPKNFDLQNSGGFGFKLINIMVKQIDGNLNYDHLNNTFTLEFILC